MTDPLPRGQQILLQRIFAEHVVTEDQAMELFHEMEDDIGANDLLECFASINKQLTKGFGLEIVTMIGAGGKKCHAVICQHACEVSKLSFPHVDANLRSYIRLILELLVEGPSARSTLINLRGELKDPLKLDLDKADKCIENLLEEFWLENEPESRQRIRLGPRAYLELSQLLTDLGMSEDDLPQLIFHR